MDPIEARVDLVKVMERTGVVLIQQKGDGYKALCPFHAEKVPSFSVTPSKRLWHCFGCGAAGTPTQFVMRYLGLPSRADAIEKIRSWGLWPEADERVGSVRLLTGHSNGVNDREQQESESAMNGPNSKIGWCDYTWNPVTGCKFDCRFGETAVPCYAAGIAARFAGKKAWPNGFEPTFHSERLGDPMKVKTPAKIFVSSMGDLFGPWVPDEWIQAVIEAMAAAPHHTFQCLTKAPWVAKKWVMPANVWLGTTITGGLPNEPTRLECVREFQAGVRFVSCEPLVAPVDLSAADPNWVIIGAATGPGAFQPNEAWVTDIENYAAAKGIPIYHKENLKIRPVRRREWPAAASISQAAA